MNLNLFKNMINNIKKDDNIQNFLNELKNSKEVVQEENIGILEKIESKNKLSIGTRNLMESKMEEILKEYAKETIDKGKLYFLVEKSETDNLYITYKYEENDDSVLKIPEIELPNNAKVNSILRLENEKYVLDEEATMEIETRINNMAEEQIKEQNRVLGEYRKEGHLYRVSENINNSVFLWDLTDKPQMEIEEVDFPEELLNIATEGRIFEYINGTYRLKE